MLRRCPSSSPGGFDGLCFLTEDAAAPFGARYRAAADKSAIDRRIANFA
jgi:hypothetical protein